MNYNYILIVSPFLRSSHKLPRHFPTYISTYIPTFPDIYLNISRHIPIFHDISRLLQIQKNSKKKSIFKQEIS